VSGRQRPKHVARRQPAIGLEGMRRRIARQSRAASRRQAPPRAGEKDIQQADIERTVGP